MYALLRRSLAALAAGTFLLVLAASGLAGSAARAGSGAAAHPAGDAVLVAYYGNGNGNGGTGGGGTGGNGGGGNGNGNGGTGTGTATPELPSGVLFGVGLLPLVIAGAWFYRRRRSAVTD